MGTEEQNRCSPDDDARGERVRRKGNGAGILATLESDFFDSRIWPRRIAFASCRVRVLKRLLVGRVVKVSESWLGSGSGFERAPRVRSRKLALLATIPEDKSLRSIPPGKVGALHLRVCGHTLVVAEPSAYDMLIGSFLVSLCLLEGVKLLLAT